MPPVTRGRTQTKAFVVQTCVWAQCSGRDRGHEEAGTRTYTQSHWDGDGSCRRIAWDIPSGQLPTGEQLALE